MRYYLPQHEPYPEERTRQLVRSRDKYVYNYTYIPEAPMSSRVPAEDVPSLAWLEKVAAQLITILVNTAKVDHALAHEDHETLRQRWSHFLRAPVEELMELFHEEIDPLLPGKELVKVAEVFVNVKQHGIKWVFQHLVDKGLIGVSKGRADSLAAFATLFQEIPRQAILDSYARDDVFAQMRLQGPNPMMIRRVGRLDDRFPVTNAIYQVAMGDRDTLDCAGAEGRLFLADYAALHDAQCGIIPDGQKFLAAPLALFAVPRGGGELRPVAIQCGQAPGPTNPIFTPRDGHGWMIAKSLVQTADGNVHQAVTHLARAHLVLECFVMATRRQLADNHPLGALLWPHFEGTVAINEAAQASLMADGNIVDRLLCGKIEVSRKMAAEGRASFSFNQAIPREGFRERGVDDPSVLTGYAYRDDVLLLWDALRIWVDDYLRAFYTGDQDVREDTELQAWLAELMAQDGGRMRDIGEDGAVKSLAYLVDAVTLIIFTCSCQHSAVNFPQLELMSYAVNFPLAGYQPAPLSKDGLTEQSYLDLLPPLDMAHLQLDIGYLLGNVRHTTLGGYPKSLARHAGGPVPDALKRFQARLEEIERTIADRNLSRPHYDFLQPSRIPQSINI